MENAGEVYGTSLSILLHDNGERLFLFIWAFHITLQFMSPQTEKTQINVSDMTIQRSNS